MSSMLNNQSSLFVDHHQDDENMSAQIGFFSFPSSTTVMNINFPESGNCSHQSLLKPNQLSPGTLIPSSSSPVHQLLSLDNRSSSTTHSNLWAWADLNESLINNKRSSVVGDRVRDVDHHHQQYNHHLGVSAMKMKKMNKARRKVREPRFCFKTLSDVDVLDDGYKWRKYGQKVVKNTQHPRSYYRCTQDNCRVKKRVERLAEDPRMVITTYEGRHVHSPSLDMEESQACQSHHNNDFFW